ncbi:MAG: HNH endonuclease [Flavobacteriales bacterium]|nr:HNH endonuclease [Flavobacteriales bacterium]
MEEIWKDIPNYEGKYQVSNKGRVKSMARRAKSGIKNGLTHRPVNERILKPSITKGYYMVVLSDKTRHAFTVHGLVARVFIGPRNGFVVDHIDGNKLNNELVNLEYVSPTENSLRYRRAAKSSSVYVGVSKRQNKTRAVWQANIQINNKKTNLGIFLTEEEAHEAYQKVSNSVIDKKYTNEY